MLVIARHKEVNCVLWIDMGPTPLFDFAFCMSNTGTWADDRARPLEIWYRQNRNKFV